MTQRQSGYEGIDELGGLDAVIKLLAKLEEGELSARENGWITADEIETALE